MGVVTKLEVQKHNKDRVNVYIDGTFAFGLNMDSAVKNKLKVGIEVDSKDLEEIAFDSDIRDCRTRAYDYISRYYKSSFDIRKKMTTWGYSDLVIDTVIRDMTESGYIDDTSYAKSVMESSKGCGRAKIVAKLMSKGISKDIINEVMQDFKVDSDEITRLAEKFMKSKDINADNIAKLVRHLMSKGFEYSDISDIINVYRTKI